MLRTRSRRKRQWIEATVEGSAAAGGSKMASAAADGAIFVWLTIFIVLGANLPLGYRILRRNSMKELAPEFFSPSRD